MQAHNTFDNPGAVGIADFAGATLTEKGFTASLPPKSVVLLTLE
jgi:alpha-L-arabinofuranosidase